MASTEGLSTYELARLERIKANQAQLAALGIVEAKEEFGASVTPKGPRKNASASGSRKRVARAPEVASRSSGRLKGDAPKFYGDLGDDMFDELAAQQVTQTLAAPL
jgi:hypothetical protein